jgi:hypothetical protein
VSEGGIIAKPPGSNPGSMGDGIRPPLLPPPKL